MTRTALFPGSFDPFTAGHEAIVRRGLALFDKIYVAVGVNTDKQYMFTVEERLDHIRSFFKNESRVEAISFCVASAMPRTWNTNRPSRQ